MATILQFPSGRVLQPDSTKQTVADIWREAMVQGATGLTACIRDIARAGEPK